MLRARVIRASMFSLGLIAAGLIETSGARANEAYAALVHRHAAAHGLPPALVHRVIMRESRYNHRAVSKGNYGIMQIRLGTARAMGYSGNAAGLLDPNTNMTYAVKYLAGAYRAAGGNPDRAVALYTSGYGGARVARASAVYAFPMASMAAAPTVGAIGAPLPVFSPAARRARGEYVPVRMPRGMPSAVTTSREFEIR